MTYVNPTLALLVVFAGCAGAAVWNSPGAANRLAQILRARATALQEYRARFRELCKEAA